MDRGFTTSGIYLVQPTDNGEPIEVFCDMETDYGGWTVGEYPTRTNLFKSTIPDWLS